MATPDEHIESMKALCETLAANETIRSAWVDDWGRYSNFAVMVVPMHHDRHTTNRLKALVKRELRGTGAHLRECFPPEPEVIWNSCEQRREIRGYNRDFWSFDVDYREYDAASNSFAA